MRSAPVCRTCGFTKRSTRCQCCSTHKLHVTACQQHAGSPILFTVRKAACVCDCLTDYTVCTRTLNFPYASHKPRCYCCAGSLVPLQHSFGRLGRTSTMTSWLWRVRGLVASGGEIAKGHWLNAQLLTPPPHSSCQCLVHFVLHHGAKPQKTLMHLGPIAPPKDQLPSTNCIARAGPYGAI